MRQFCLDSLIEAVEREQRRIIDFGLKSFKRLTFSSFVNRQGSNILVTPCRDFGNSISALVVFYSWREAILENKDRKLIEIERLQENCAGGQLRSERIASKRHLRKNGDCLVARFCRSASFLQPS